MRAKKGCDQPRTAGLVAMQCDQVEQRRFTGLVQRIPRFSFQRRRPVSENRAQPRANRRLVESGRIEERLARALDRVAHAERRILAANAGGEIRFAIAGEEWMRVRVNEARHDHTITQV